MKQLNEKVAVVTGSSTGIGRAVAFLFAAEGADVIVTSNASKEDGVRVANDLIKLGSNASYFQADLTKKEDVEKLFNHVKEKYGKLDILV